MNRTVRHRETPSNRLRHRAAAIFAVAAAVIGSVAMIGLDAGITSAARTWFVAVDGDDGASGSSDEPLATIDQAVRRAVNGDTIQIGPGVYHESVQVYRESLTIAGAGIGVTVLDGARTVTGFSQDGDGRWSAPWSTHFERADPYHTLDDRPEAGWPEQFFLDGVQLGEVTQRSAVGPGTFYFDTAASRVVLGDDPSSRLVEGSDLSWGLYLNHADGSSVTGLTVQRYGTEQRHMAAFRAYADDLTVTDVEVVDNARIGLSVIGDRVDVARVSAVDNGYLGMHAHQADDLAIIDSEIHRNNRERFDPWHAAGGFKTTEGHGLDLIGNDVRDNWGPGLWTDLDVRDVVVAGNTVVGNFRSGVEIELSSDVIVVDNVVANNGEQGVWVLESSRVDVWHNHLTHNERAVWVLDGPRADLVDVSIGNNVMGGNASSGLITGVDDWTEQRNGVDMRVSFDGNRYWNPGSAAALMRWANWPASLTIASDLATIRQETGNEASAEVSTAATSPWSDASGGLVPTPAHVTAVRTTALPTPASTTTTTTTTTTSTTTTTTTTAPSSTTTTSLPAPTTSTTMPPAPTTTSSVPARSAEVISGSAVVVGDARASRGGSPSSAIRSQLAPHDEASAVDAAANTLIDQVGDGWQGFSRFLDLLLEAAE